MLNYDTQFYVFTHSSYVFENCVLNYDAEQVLLKNKGGVLPLQTEAFRGKEHSLAVVGPLADDVYVLLGAANYAYHLHDISMATEISIWID
jgi:beta-glucosidase-like glycosyl hydrolase